MKRYIFYTSEGLTQDGDLNDTNNCQILDWINGEDEKDAFNNFLKGNQNISFRNLCCQELASEKIYYF